MPQHPPTSEQQAVLDASDNLIVLGGPGSGKTTVALWKARKFLLEQQLEDYQRVLFLSFSRGAVERIAQACRLDLPKALRPRQKVATYHSLCHEILRSHCPHLGLRRPFRVLERVDEIAMQNEFREQSSEAFAELERTDTKVRLDRFAPLAADLMRRHPRLRSAYGRAFPLILVDEYQDTDDAQDEFVRMLGERSQIICLGDTDQRIYDFRPGIRSDRLERLEREHGFRVVDLGTATNHRSAGTGVREFARAILNGVHATSNRVQIWRTNGRHDHLVTKIKDAVNALRGLGAREGWGPRGRSTICVMLPTNDLVRRVSRALSSLPEEERKRFRHEVLLDLEQLSIAWDFLLTVLEAASASRVDDAVREALGHLARFHAFNPAAGAQESAGRLRAWAAGNGRSPFLTSLRSTVGALPGTFSGDPIADLDRLVALLAEVRGEYARGCIELLQLRMPGALEPHIRRTLREKYGESNTYEGAVAIGHEHLVRERLSDRGMSRRPLSLMTLHKCKGKEFDAVILGEAAQSPGRFLNSDEARSRTWPKSRRLLHVAITRARHRAILLTPAYDVSPLLQPFMS